MDSSAGSSDPAYTRQANTRADFVFAQVVSGDLGDTEINRDEFFECGLRTSTNYDRTFAGTPGPLVDMLEEEFETGGSRGGS
jgi:hypothetical protein